MKAIKMFGLAVFATLMAMAFVGASSAMAEGAQLCGHDGSPCEAIRHIHLLSVGNAEILTTLGTTKCKELFLGDVLQWGPPIIISGTFTLSECTLGGAECTETEENGPTELKVLKTGEETSEVIGEYLVHLVCGKAIDCSYTGTGLKGTGKGALAATPVIDEIKNEKGEVIEKINLTENGEVKISEAALTKEVGGFFCPKTAKLHITLAPLSPIYIAPRLLGYCVKAEHSNGIYTNNTCTTVGATTGHVYEFTLVWAPEGSEVNKTLCYGTLLKYGLWKVRNPSGECDDDDLGAPTTSLYEKGVIKLVE